MRPTSSTRIAALKELLGYYKEITETIREPFIILDKNLRVVTANAAFYRKFKVNKHDTEGRRIYELGNNQWNAPKLRELLENILPEHKVMSGYEVTHEFPIIGHRTVILNARQVDSKQLILLAMEDVTDRIKFLHDTEEVKTNLTEQRDTLRMLNAAKDEFISLASHQLRTPATIVKQYIGMLHEGFSGSLTTEQSRMLQVAYDSNERQLEIIEDLLRVARIDDGKVLLDKSPCNVGHQIETVIKNQAVLFESRNQHAIFEEPDSEVIATIDERLIGMVLENLVDNAGKYSPKGATITIRAEQTAFQTIITVQDQGVGIRQSDMTKLFKKFSRIDNPLSLAVVGTGLGLYWAKKVVDLHDGSIAVTSKVHTGSTFTVTLPIVTF